MSTLSLPRDHRIDVLRGVSILLVLILHFHIAYDLAESPFATFFSARFIEALARNGNYGVTIFFVVSGYLITSTSLRRFGTLRNVSARNFYAFRFARIFPCLFLALFLITTLGLAGVPYFKSNRGNTSFLLADFSVLTFWHNVLMAKVGYFNYGLNVLWSLSVEEVFYFTFPLLCLALRKTWLIVAVWVAAILFGPIYRTWHSEDEIRFLYGYFACFDAIALGCCTALLARSFRVTNVTRSVLQGCAAVFIAWIYLRTAVGDSPTFGPTLIALGAAVFLLAEGASESVVSPWTKWEPIGWFGRHSYELYLFHVVVLAGMRNVFSNRDDLAPRWKPLWFLLFLLLATGVAGLIARFYSEPLNRDLRRRLTAAIS